MARRVVQRILLPLVAAPLLALLGPAASASAQTPPASPDPIQTILTVLSPWTVVPCQLVATANIAGSVPGVAQAFQVCASFPLPTQTSSCSVDNQIAGAAQLPSIVPTPTPEGNVVDSVAAAQQAIGSIGGQTPPDLAGQLSQGLQCTVKTPAGSVQGAPSGTSPPEASPGLAAPAVEGTTFDAGGSSAAGAPLASSADSSPSGVGSVPLSQPPTPLRTPARTSPALQPAVATAPSSNHVGWAVLIGTLVLLTLGLWAFAGRDPVQTPER